MVKALAITSGGMEEITSLEIKELINSKAQVRECAVIFSPKKLIDICYLCYKSQSASRILSLLDNFEFKYDFFETLRRKIENQNFSKWIDKTTTFAVECERVGNHDFLSSEIEKKAGEFIINNIKRNHGFKIKANLERPDIVFYIYVYKKFAYLGVDFSGFDLSKREYRIFIYPASIKGNVAYSLLRIGDYKAGEVLLDPYCSSGGIPIEAALFKTGVSVNNYRKDKFAFLKLKPFKKTNFEEFFKSVTKKIKEKNKVTIFAFDNLLKHIKSSQKNAKIAGINKHIKFSKTSLHWLDTKFNKMQIDKIMAHLPSYSQRTDKKDMDNLYNELFYQAEYVLKNKGRVVLLLEKEIPVQIPEKHNFKLIQKNEIFSGKQKYGVFVYSRKSENQHH